VEDARERIVRERLREQPRLEAEHQDGGSWAEKEAKPVACVSPGQRGDGIAFRLPSKLVPVQGNDEEVFDVLADSDSKCEWSAPGISPKACSPLPVRAPHWRDGVEHERKRVHTKLPQVLVLVSMTLLQDGNLSELG
jgi:hypothetical protein